MAKTGEEEKMNAKLTRYKKIQDKYDIITFKGGTLIRPKGSVQYKTMSSEEFARAAYELMPGLLIGQIKELEHKFRAQAPDLSRYTHLVAVGGQAWDTRQLSFVPLTGNEVFRAKVTPVPLTESDYKHSAAWGYMRELSNGDSQLAWDMLQAIAPLFMDRKPAGVVWFIGEGANGKSALMSAIYKIVGEHLCSMTVAAIEDGRDAPRLNGQLGNVCRESSEAKVEDSEKYKALGTHEPFEVHKFHSQDMVTVTGDLHHIFNANNIPIFNDKTMGARRRTLVVPFPATFKDDPGFEERTFTPTFLGELFSLILLATHMIKKNKYSYLFGQATLTAKDEYDNQVNSAEAYLNHMRKNRVKAFSNYRLLRIAYEGWCANEGHVPLGITNLKRVMQTRGAVGRRTVRLEDGSRDNWYFLDSEETRGNTDVKGLTSFPNGMHVDVLSQQSATEIDDENTEQVRRQSSLLTTGW